MRFSRIHTSTGIRVCAVDESGAAHPVRFADTGAAVEDLHQIIEAGPGATARLQSDQKAAGGDLLAPIIPRRNVFCVGRNYSEHAAEFAKSGFDATDNNASPIPEFPVVFTKPAATVIASGQPVDPHTDITSTLDYEGEIGVIIGKRASKVSKADAMDYVWGYTLINDVTARDLQRTTNSGSSASPSTRSARWARGPSPPTRSTSPICNCRPASTASCARTPTPRN